MALTLTVVSSGWVPAVSFAASASVSLDLGTGFGRAILAFAIMDRDSSTSEPQTCRAGSTGGSGGTLMSAGALQPMYGGATHRSSRLFTLDSATIDAAGAGLTGAKEVWMAAADGNAKPSLRVVVVQSSDGRALTVGDLAVAQAVVTGSAAATQAAGSPSAEAVGAVFVVSDGFTVATASSGNTLLVAGQTDAASYCVDVVQKPGIGAALTVGWQPGSINQTQARHVVSLTAAGAGPVLSVPAGTATGPTQATIGLTTDTAPTTTAISYQILPAATAAPSAAAIVGTPTGTISTGSAGALTAAITGLTTNTDVKIHFAQGVTSNVVSGASFTPSTLAIAGTALSAQTGTAGAAFTWAGSTPESLLTNTGNGSGSWSATAGASGVTVNSATGILVAATLGTAGSYTITLQRADGSTVPSAQTVTKTVGLTISGGSTPVAFTGTVPGQFGTIGSAFSLALASYFSGSLTPFTYSVLSGSLPAGLSLNSSTGAITGTPTTAAGYSAVVRATDTGTNTAQTGTISFTISASVTPVSFSGAVPAQTATQGSSYSLALAPYFSGSETPFAYSVLSGALPTGVSLNASTGALSGMPSSAGSFSAVVRATDTATNAAQTGTIAFTVNAPGAYTATVGQLAEAGVAMAAGRTIYWTLQMGNGPGGLSGGAQGTATTDASGNISVTHSVAGRALVNCSTVAPGTVNDLRPVQTQIVTLA